LAKEWLAGRDATHSTAKDDRIRWEKHLSPIVGEMKLDEVTPSFIRKSIILPKLAEVSSSTVKRIVALLSTFYSDQLEDERVANNPCRLLQKKTRRLMKEAHDPLTTPWLERVEDIRRLHQALEGSVSRAFVIGALAGLRSGELIGLDWSQINLEKRLITVDRQYVVKKRLLGSPKGGQISNHKSRTVPIQESLYPLLAEARLAASVSDRIIYRKGVKGQVFACTGLVCPPLTLKGRRPKDRPADERYLTENTLGRYLGQVLAFLQIPPLTWYQATRHTFASHWVTNGGPLPQLQKIMGHTTYRVTERYAHIAEKYRQADHDRVVVNFLAPDHDRRPLKLVEDAACPICSLKRSRSGPERPWVEVDGVGYHSFCLRVRSARSGT
jgi:integrase